jgi:hypothetical protein
MLLRSAVRALIPLPALVAVALADEVKLEPTKVDQNFRECLLLNVQNGTYSSSDSSSTFELVTTCRAPAKAWIDQCTAGGSDRGECNGRALATAEATIKFLGK